MPGIPIHAQYYLTQPELELVPRSVPLTRIHAALACPDSGSDPGRCAAGRGPAAPRATEESAGVKARESLECVTLQQSAPKI